MFTKGDRVQILGTLVVNKVGDIIDMDPYDNGKVSTVERRANQGKIEFDCNGAPKEFDGYQVGDFMSFTQTYEVLEGNEFDTLVNIDGDKVLIPNNRIMEVD